MKLGHQLSDHNRWAVWLAKIFKTTCRLSIAPAFLIYLASRRFSTGEGPVGAFSVIVKSSQSFVRSCTAQSFWSRLLLWTDAVILSVFNSADICGAAAQVPGPAQIDGDTRHSPAHNHQIFSVSSHRRSRASADTLACICLHFTQTFNAA